DPPVRRRGCGEVCRAPLVCGRGGDGPIGDAGAGDCPAFPSTSHAHDGQGMEALMRRGSVAQCLALCRVYIRAETLHTPSPCARPSRAQRGPSLRPTPVEICQPQPPTHAETLRDPRSPAPSVVRTPGRVLMTTGARLRSRVRGTRARGVLQQRWMERSLPRLSPPAVHCGHQRTHLVSLLVRRYQGHIRLRPLCPAGDATP